MRYKKLPRQVPSSVVAIDDWVGTIKQAESNAIRLNAKAGRGSYHSIGQFVITRTEIEKGGKVVVVFNSDGWSGTAYELGRALTHLARQYLSTDYKPKRKKDKVDQMQFQLEFLDGEGQAIEDWTTSKTLYNADSDDFEDDGIIDDPLGRDVVMSHNKALMKRDERREEFLIRTLESNVKVLEAIPAAYDQAFTQMGKVYDRSIRVQSEAKDKEAAAMIAMQTAAGEGSFFDSPIGQMAGEHLIELLKQAPTLLEKGFSSIDRLARAFGKG